MVLLDEHCREESGKSLLAQTPAAPKNRLPPQNEVKFDPKEQKPSHPLIYDTEDRLGLATFRLSEPRPTNLMVTCWKRPLNPVKQRN